MLTMGQEQLLCWLWDKNNFYVGYGTRTISMLAMAATSMLAMGQEQLLCWLWDKNNFYVARKDH